VTVAISDYSDLTTSDYRLTSNGGGNYTLLRLSDNQVLVNNAALPASIDGLAITVAGGPAAGNSFLIQPTRGGGANIAMRTTDPREIAAAAPVRTMTPTANTGTASINELTVANTTGLHLAAPIQLTFDAANDRFNVTGGPGGTIAYDPAIEGAGKTFTFAAFGGMSFTIKGTPANGDQFVIERNSSGVSDNRNGALLAALQTANTMMGDSANGVNPTATYQSAYSAIVAQIGNKTREVEVSGDAQQALLERTQSIQAELSGVNLDEEAANLIRFQQAYQAAAKVIGIAGTLFDEILAVAR
jgi:flagellar hook-associated protein 1 FlgK